ncbi:MAG: HIT family protein [Blastocatellia bacterium]
MAPQSCYICGRVEAWRNGENAHFIHEFEHSIMVLGEHQFHPGYSLLLLKEHRRELHELAPEAQAGLFQELMIATQAIVRAFQPWKMNHSCYGNAQPHVHWHLFPRYDTLPDHQNHPWLHAAEFDTHIVDIEEARRLVRKIQQELPAG